jgi:hypothetical protein
VTHIVNAMWTSRAHDLREVRVVQVNNSPRLYVCMDCGLRGKLSTFNDRLFHRCRPRWVRPTAAHGWRDDGLRSDRSPTGVSSGPREAWWLSAGRFIVRVVSRWQA